MKLPRALRVLANPNVAVIEGILEHLTLVNETQMESNNAATGQRIFLPGPAYIAKLPEMEEMVAAVAAGTVDQPKNGLPTRVLRPKKTSE
ncbi:unnamed protein product [Echinostoma caproni]|uniref:Rho-GAP domain-containing protein n=1 Tax=Echinostoma caproni TaxID=27848 RepID=A0A183B902_9TREM|nr:unnamed protein product [Echinostoma caproni]